MLHSGFYKDRNVRKVETAQYHLAFLLDSLREARQVGKQDVAVDVGYQEVGFRLPFEHRTVATNDCDTARGGQGARDKGQELLAPCSSPPKGG